MKKILLGLLVALSPVILVAQQKIAVKSNLLNNQEPRRCSTFEKMQEIKALDPVAYEQNRLKQEQIIQNWISTNYNSKAKVVYTIPVVVQIFGSTPNTQVTNNRVNEQLAVLNQDFRRMNSDTNLTPAAFKSIAADSEIEFCLATLDPQGNPTTGIVRKTSVNSPSTSDLWDASKYLNLFVYSISGGTLGYTYLPSSSPNNAVHIGYQYFGKTGATSPYNKGRTATHEIGHWFNLEHIWADEPNCSADDGVSDTPQQKGENYGCPSYPQTTGAGGRCSTNDPSSMFMNYMDYSDDNCMNLFSAGQKARMIAAINTYRPGLLNNGKCGVIQPVPPVAAFNASMTTIAAGSCVSFTDQSTNSPTSWAWSFSGAVTTSSNQQNPANICYNDTGCFNVILIATNADGSDTLVQNCMITVVQPGSLPCDTVSNFKSTDTPTIYGSNQWGYVSGHNNYDDRGKAEFFTAPPSGYTIDGARFWFGAKHAGSPNSNIAVKLWSSNNGSPGTVIYSQTVPVSSLLKYPQETFINFTSPQTVTGDYFLGIQFSANGSPQDTVALISNAEDETSPGTAWELWNDGNWYAIKDSWGINFSLAIWAIRCPADTGTTSCNISATTSTVDPTCYSAYNGSITVNVSGGTGPLTYAWNQGAGSTATVTGLAAGSYTVTVSDGNQCQAIATATLTQPAALAATVSSVNVSCNGGSNGTATVSASGGTSPYTYAWSSGGSTATVTGLTSGTYTVTVFDNKQCQKTASVSISQPAILAYSVSSVQAGCGLSNGSATVMVSGGNPPYSYLWNNSQNTSTVSGLSAGNYSVVITDSKSCTANASVAVGNVNGPSVSVDSVNATAYGVCDGSATAIVSGGTTPYTYSWNNDSTTASITGLCAGSYEVTVTDVNDCKAASSVSISQPLTINSSSFNEGDISIFPNPSNGKITITSGSFSEPFTIKVYNVIGEVVRSEKRERITNGKFELDLSVEEKGVYFVEIKSGDKTTVRKISIMK